MVESLTGQDIQQEWYHQFLGDTVNTKLLANKINDFFVSLTDHFTLLTRDSPPSLVPQELFVSNEEVFRSLSSLNVAKAEGPDNIPNKLLKDFAHELVPIIRNVYNQSLINPVTSKMKDLNLPLHPLLPIRLTIPTPTP